MAALSARDYCSVLDVLRVAGAADGPDPFPEPVLEALRELIPCDVVAYHERFEPWDRPTIRFTGEPGGPTTTETRAAHQRYLSQDPLVVADGARKYSDYLTRREYHRLDLYEYVDRPLGIEHMMRLWIDPRGAADARLEFDRGTRDFGERDRAVLDLMLPHLRQFQRRAALRRRLPQPISSGCRVTRRELDVIAHVADGRTNAEIAWALGISPGTVRKHLENAYAKLGVHTRTGAAKALFGPVSPSERSD